MSGRTEALARVKIDALLQDAGWNLSDGSSVLFEHALPDGTQADYALCDRQGRQIQELACSRKNLPPLVSIRHATLVERLARPSAASWAWR